MVHIYNVAIIGTGDAAQEHYKVIKENKKLTLEQFNKIMIERNLNQ